MAQFSLYSATLVGGSTINMNQLEQMDAGANAQIEEYAAAGAVDRQTNLLMSADPKVTIVTPDLAGALSISPTVGFDCTSGGTFRFQKRTSNGVYSADGHRTLTATKAWACLRRFAVQQNQMARANVEVFCQWDGSTIPLASNTGAELASAPASNSHFTLGSAKVGSTALPGLIGVDLDFGLVFEPRLYNGEAFAREGFITQRRPKIKLEFDVPDAMNTAGSLFHASLGNSLVIYLRRMTGGSATGRAANNSGTHISITVATGTWQPERIGASGHGSAMLSIGIDPTGTIAVASNASIS